MADYGMGDCLHPQGHAQPAVRSLATTNEGVRVTVAASKAEGLVLIQKLVATFAANRPHYKSRLFDETSTRTLFIDKLFEALGWDVTR